MFYLYRVENGNHGNSSETYLESSQTTRSSYLEQLISIFIRIFEFYVVTQSL
jgi:hypothetical protein